MSGHSSKKPRDSPVIARRGPAFPAGPEKQSRVLSQNYTGGLTPFKPLNGLQEIPVANREGSEVLCFHSKRGLTPRVKLECIPKVPLPLERNTEFLDTSLEEVYLPCSDSRVIPSSLMNSNGDWTYLGQQERPPEFPVENGESRRNSRKTTRFPHYCEMKPFPAAASQEISRVSS